MRPHALLALGLCACAGSQGVRDRCPRALDGSFVQLSGEQTRFDRARWERALRVVRARSGGEVFVQFTGDRDGAFDARAHGDGGVVRPIEALLAAADALGVRVHLGLHHDARWPERAGLDALPAPLGDEAATAALGALCGRHASCVGWYLSPEVDDLTHGAPATEARLRGWLARSTARLRALGGTRSVSVSTFRGGRYGPEGFARFWGRVLPGSGVDVLLFQDGGGTGRGDPETSAAYLRALRPVTDRASVRLGAVVELFEQVHGPPVDEAPFFAVPAPYATVRARIDVARVYADHVVAFSLLDYAAPGRGRAAEELGVELSGACAPWP